MADKISRNASAANGNTNAPLFTGDARRDRVVSELEKAAEVSQAVFARIAEKRNDRAKKTGKNP